LNVLKRKESQSMKTPSLEASRWLEQAEDDLNFARYAMNGKFFHQVCFICQQSSEKALKAVYYADGARNVLGHSVTALIKNICEKHPALGKFFDAAAELDLYYIPTRYPNGLVEGTPKGAFTRSQAERALNIADMIIQGVRAEMTLISEGD